MKKLYLFEKMSVILLSFMLIISLFVSTISVCYASDDIINEKEYEKLVKAYESSGQSFDCSTAISTMSIDKANSLISLPQSAKYDFKVEKAYNIKRVVGDNLEEDTVYADILVTPKAGALSSVTESKAGRVSVSCTLGYERLTKNSISHVKGTYVGGKVTGQQNGIKVTSVSATYHEVGPYITSSGGSGIASDYKKTYSLDLSKKNQFQKKTLSRTRFFNTENAVGSVDGKYTAKYKVNGGSKEYSISVNAKAQ